MKWRDGDMEKWGNGEVRVRSWEVKVGR